MELTAEQKVQIYCAALQGILTTASAQTVMTGDPAAHALRVANRAISLLGERGLAIIEPASPHPSS